METVKSRNYSLDLLRILCCIAILIYHLPFENEALKSVTYIFSTPALAIFFMFAGFFGSAPNPGDSAIYPYYKKKFVHIGMPLFLFTIFYGYIYFQQLKDIFCKEGINYILAGIKQSFLGVFAGPNINQMWFMYDILAVYIIWPFIKVGLDGLKDKGQRKLLYLIALLQLFISLYFLKKGILPYYSAVIYLNGWLIYPLLGYMAKKDWIKRYDKFLWVAGPICLVFNIYMAITEKLLGGNVEVFTFSPVTIIQSLFIFRLFLGFNLKPSKILKYLSERTFTAYLLGAFTTMKVDQVINNEFIKTTLPGMLIIIVILTVVTFALASVLDEILLKNLEKACFFVIDKIESLAEILKKKVKK
ncbi:MAG: acyltransferase [Lachnospiraceae bacterium]|nr:acyltransferase [Lachnospiraceae bacterium]